MSIPDVVSRFENFLWVHSRKDWSIKTIFFQDLVYVSIIIQINSEKMHKIRKTFSLKLLQQRDAVDDLLGLAADYIDLVKSETKNL